MNTSRSILAILILATAMAVPATAQIAEYRQYGTGCDGGIGTPNLLAVGSVPVPLLGETFSTLITTRTENGLAFGILGFSNTSNAGVPLPLDLSIIGMPGCLLHTEIWRTFPLVIGQFSVSWDIDLPSDPAWIGRSFFQQAMVIDPAITNALGINVSNANEGIIGTEFPFPTVPITDLRTGVVAFGSPVTIAEELYVTAVFPPIASYTVFTVQTSILEPFNGILVLAPTASNPSVAIGNRVSMRGVLNDFFGVFELIEAEVTVLDSGTTLPFAPFLVSDPSTIATGGSDAVGLESMLLRIENVQVTNANPDAPDDLDQFLVTGGLRIDDRIHPALGNDFPVGTSFTSIQGVLDLSFSENHLLPRDSLDLVEGPFIPPTVVSFTPNPLVIEEGGSGSLTLSLSSAAPIGGVVVSLNLTSGTLGSIPTAVVVPMDSSSTTVSVQAGAIVGVAVITATLDASTTSATINVIPDLPNLIINEVDYDQPSFDDSEFIEIYNPSPFDIPLANHVIELINGSTGEAYQQIDLSTSGVLASGQYLVIGSAAALASVPSTELTLTMGNNFIQNGSPDGIALLDTSAFELLDALSYEGSITAVNSLIGLIDLVEGTPTQASDSGSATGSLSRIPSGVDTDDAATDWTFTSTPTPGSANVN